MIPEKVKKVLKKQHYSIVGKHSAVQACRWTKKSLTNEGVCYKEQFYGIKSHLCCQMSPSVMWCPNRCLHCWRAVELTIGNELKGKVDKPKDIRQAAAQLAIQRRILLDKAATEENQRLALARIAAESRQKDIFDVLKEGNIPLGSFLGSYEAANREGGPGVLINKYYLTKDNVLVRIDKGKDGQPLPTALAKI